MQESNTSQNSLCSTCRLWSLTSLIKFNLIVYQLYVERNVWILRHFLIYTSCYIEKGNVLCQMTHNFRGPDEHDVK